MIKCPLCGWNNPESTQHCASCGGDLERRTGLIREEGNPDCYSFTPPRRILNKGVGVAGSGNDLVFRFSNSFYVILLIAAKLLLFAVMPHMIVNLYRDDNSLFYIFIPLSILHIIDVIGWILFAYGGRKKKRVLMRFGMRFLYAFHAIALAYCVLTVLIILFLSVAIGLSSKLGTVLTGVVGPISSKQVIYVMAAVAIILLALIIFLNICAKFFYYTLDMFIKNTVKYYKFTGVIFVGFIIMTVLSLTCMVLMFCKDGVLDFVSRYGVLNEYLYPVIEESSVFVAVTSGLFSIVTLLSAVIVIEYIKNYRRLFANGK